MEPSPAFDVLVVGEAVIDIVKSADGVTEHGGGSPANVALGLGRRGASVALLTSLATDARGQSMTNRLGESGVHILRRSLTASKTSTATANIGPDGQAEYQFDITWPRIEDAHDVRAGIIHTGSIAAFVEPGASSVRHLLQSTKAREITFDPNIRPSLLGSRREAVAAFEATAGLCTVVKMSDQDAAWLYPDLSPAETAAHVRCLGPRLVAITLGAEGALLTSGAHEVHVDAESVDAVDTIGAGDTFMASMITDLIGVGSECLAPDDLKRIGRAATAAAAITVSRSGADLPWRHELASPSSWVGP